jgi:hypothetical protein
MLDLACCKRCVVLLTQAFFVAMTGYAATGAMEAWNATCRQKGEEIISPAYSQSSKRYDTHPVQHVILCAPECIILVIPSGDSQE